MPLPPGSRSRSILVRDVSWRCGRHSANPGLGSIWPDCRHHRVRLDAGRQPGDQLAVACRRVPHGPAPDWAVDAFSAGHLSGDGGRRGVQNRTDRHARARSDARRIAGRRAGGMRLVVLLPFVPSVEHRFQELGTLCADTGTFSSGGSFSFNFGSTPPPGIVLPTPPPEFFATPPPGAFATPPPGAFVFPPAGPRGTLGLVLQMLITILIGTGGAVGIATIAGQAGTAARSRARPRGPN